MKTIDVQPQPILSLKRIFAIALSGVKYRLFRAVVTVAVITVAMAFLMNILTESLIKKAVANSARDQIANLHRVDQWIARLSVPQTGEQIIAGLAQADPADPYVAELAGMSGKTPDDLASLQATARSAQEYLQFFQDMNYGRRRVLVGRAESARIFDHLQDPGAYDKFTANLSHMKTLRFPTEADAFQAFLAEWPTLRDWMGTVRDGQAKAIEQIKKSLGNQPLVEALRNADGDFGETLRQAGFALGTEEAASLSREVKRLDNMLLIESTINNPELRQAVAAKQDILPGDVSVALIWDLIDRSHGAAWYVEEMNKAGLDTEKLDPAFIRDLAGDYAHAQLLKYAERQTLDTGGGLMGIGARMTWLALVSMLVCAVGIANAMLMSVTERFREIATLKCLGALDGFIMTVFLIEAGILGIVGGIAGTLIGLVLAILRMALGFQSLLVQSFPALDLVKAGLISILLGMILAAIAAVYPSFRAARLAPMEAMRIE